MKSSKSLNAQTEFLNENFSECLKQLVLEVKMSVNSALPDNQAAASTSIHQQLISAVNSISVTSKSGASVNNNEYLLFLLTSTHNLTNWLDSLSLKSSPELQLINASTALFFNNVAVVHFSLHKFNLSSLYLQRALDENSKFINKCAERTESTSGLQTNRANEILLNLGVSLLFSKQPIAAFECLIKAATVYKSNARLWLRIAESCIMCYRHSVGTASINNPELPPALDITSSLSNNEKMLRLSEKSKCVYKSVGQGYHHKIILGSELSREPSYNGFKLSDWSNKSGELQKLATLEFAYTCLKTALNLLPSLKEIEEAIKSIDERLADGLATEEGETDEEAKELDSTRLKTFNCVSPSKPLSLSELQSLRSSILVNLAYVSLCLKDYANTIRYSNLILSIDHPLNAKFSISNGNR